MAGSSARGTVFSGGTDTEESQHIALVMAGDAVPVSWTSHGQRGLDAFDLSGGYHLRDSIRDHDEAGQRALLTDACESLERWTSSSSLNQSKNREPARRKSSEMSTNMKSRLEAFEKAQREEEERERAKKAVELENNEHVGHFREKLKNFQKISSQTDLGVERARNSVSSDRKPPPPLGKKFTQM